MKKLILLFVLSFIISIHSLKAQTYKAADILGTWELSDKKAKIIFKKSMKFTYSWQGLTTVESFNGTYKLIENKGTTTIEFKRDNGAGWPSKIIKSLSPDKKKIELKWGTLVETYNKI
jgi:hypothetical protein